MRVPVAVALLAAFAACREPMQPPTLRRCPPGTTLTMSVSSGTTPAFTWTPDCHPDRLAVWEEGGSAQRMWELVDSIPPGLRYGVVPSGRREVVAAKPLVSGARYRVSASSVSEFGGGAAGDASFVP